MAALAGDVRGILTCYRFVVGTPEVGLYLTLSDESQPGDRDRLAIGPFDELTVRSARVVGERGRFSRIIAAHGPSGGWLGVDAEMQRSFATEPIAANLSHIRVRAQGAQMFLRLLDDAPDRSAAVPELGPFDLVVIGTHDIGADGRTIAVRVAPTAPWVLTDLAGGGLQGMAKEILTFRAGVSATSQTTGRHSVDQPDALPASTFEESPPSVWVDRVRARSEIYISRPDASKKP
jgi:hypothetical protein